MDMDIESDPNKNMRLAAGDDSSNPSHSESVLMTEDMNEEVAKPNYHNTEDSMVSDVLIIDSRAK